MTIQTTLLTNSQLFEEASFVEKWLWSEGIRQTTVRHGKFDEWTVGVDGLAERLEKGFDFPGFRLGPDKTPVEVIVPNACRLGAFDLEINTDPLETQVTFCHESHIHIVTENGTAADMFRSRWQALGYI